MSRRWPAPQTRGSTICCLSLSMSPICVCASRWRSESRLWLAKLDERTNAVRFHASHDSLTGLWNRESLLNLLFPETDRVQRMRTPLTLLLLDLDRFSGINDEYGYE